MTDHDAFEAKLGTAYERYLAGAPVKVDAAAVVAAVVAAGARPGTRMSWRRSPRLREAIAVLVALALMGGVIAAGGLRLLQESTPPPPSAEPSPTSGSTATSAPSPTATQDTAGRLEGHIYVDGFGTSEIFRSNPDGAWMSLGISGSCPTLSPDGRTLAYMTFVGDGFALAVSDPDGRNERLLWVGQRDEESLRQITWVPGSRSVSLTGALGTEGQQGNLVIGHLDGRPATLLRHGALGHPGTPSWSPDGTRMAVGLHRPEGRIEIRSAEGVTLDTIETDEFIWDVKWSPLGDVIAYTASSDVTDSKSLHFVRPDGSGDVVVAAGDDGPFGDLGDLAWSPDGSRLAAFNRQSVFRFSIEVFDQAGIHVASLGGLDYSSPVYPTWSPDGQSVLITGGPDEAPYVLGLDGTERGVSAPGGVRTNCPLSWGPA